MQSLVRIQRIAKGDEVTHNCIMEINGHNKNLTHDWRKVKMKKLLICMLSTLTMLQCATAFAGGYDAGDNKVSVDDSTKKTVIIARNTGVKMTDDDIVYVGQEDSGFSGASFALKENPAVGFYTIILGGDGEKSAKTFFIGSAANLEENFANKIELKALSAIEAEDTQNQEVTKAYVSDNTVTLDNIKSIVVKYGNKYACEEFGTVTSGGGDVKLAVKLEGIPAADKDNVNVWISSTEISTKDLITE